MIPSSKILFAIGLTALLIQCAHAHTYLSSVVIGGTVLSQGDCVRPHPPSGPDSPISSVTSPDMTCGFLPYSAQPANRKCPVAAGSTVGVQWHHSSNASTDDILDPSHKGPVIFYLAKSDTGAGNVWFKIYQDGYNPATGAWGSINMINNHGLVTFTLPSDIAPGNYLLRGEVIALHQANVVGGAQPYVGCVELTISGSGSANPSASGVALPGAYSNSDPGIFFNLYAAFSSYIVPGPAVYVSGSSSPTTAPTNPPTSAPTTRPTNPPTSAPTNPPTNPPTSAPTNPPTTRPTNPPTSAPTNPPTAAPTQPSTGSSSSSNTLKVQLNPSSGGWWMGVIVSGGSQATVRVEIMDSGAVSSWTALSNQGYAYVFTASAGPLVLPISVRLTSSSGAQVTLSNVFTTWSASPIDSWTDYTSSRTSPTPAPPTQQPTSAPTQPSTPAPTHPPTQAPTQPATPAPTHQPGSGASVSVYRGSTEWWFGVSFSGTTSPVLSVLLSDSRDVCNILMTQYPWGFSFSAQGIQFVAPLYLHVTDTAGRSVDITIPSITEGLVVSAGNL